jgi:hypothetical protein
MHTAQQPHARDPAPGADLDDCTRVERRGEEPQRGAPAGLDRRCADLGTALGGGVQDVVLADVGLGVVPRRLQT